MNKKHQEEAIMLQNEVIEKQIAQIFLIKTRFIKTINDAEDYLCENIEVLKRYKIDAKKRKEVNNCIRRQKVYLRDIKSSSENVMDAINKLLKHGSMEDAVKAFLLSNFKRYSQGKVLYPDNYPNMGFSKEDGFSMNPLDKKVSLPLFYQGDVFSLLNMFLDLHFKLMYFWFHQADLFCVLQNKSSKKAITLNEFVSKIFARKLTRNECADAIEDELDKKK